jgi:2-polyprenyl-6-methoxyphenol hydroxylase-like FAD-dependent oxidoreductase
MSPKSNAINNQTSGGAFSQAVVIGSSIAGLTTARVLTDHFDQVTVIERDQLPDTPDFRRGVPQAWHAHTLPLRGHAMLEQLFPGLSDELLANGAVAVNGGSEMAFFMAGSWHQVSHHAAAVSMSLSRPLLETTMYRRLANHPRVQIIQEHEVVGLRTDRAGQAVTGVRLRRRHDVRQNEFNLEANLVVDASGRDSHAPYWLENLGFVPPRESVVNSFAGYASRIYRQPLNFNQTWKTLYIRPTPPRSNRDGITRGGIILPIEGDRWYVTLTGMARDYPPTDEAEFLDFARSLPTPEFYEAIREAEPLTRVSGFRRAENRVRHYDRLPRFLEGFLVSGDAAYVLNPVYAQGMTAAVMGSRALDDCLREQQRQGDLTGLAGAFQIKLSQAVADPWQLAIREDKRWPDTEVAEDIVPVRHRVSRSGFEPVPAAADLATPTRIGIDSEAESIR